VANVNLFDAQRLDAAPFDASSTLYRLDLTTSDGSITLPSGGYVICLEDASTAAGAILRCAATASNPASGASLSAACLLQSGAAITLTLESQTVLHAVMRAGTGILYATLVL
jgi:hypothetical protein